MINIIGISGRKQSGKDTVCKIIQYLTSTRSATKKGFDLQASYGYPFTSWKKKQFAGKLKEIVALMIGCNVLDLENEEFKNTPLGEEWIKWRVPAASEKNDLYITQERYETLSDNQKSWCTKEVLTPRILLQKIGTEGLRDLIHPNVHVNMLFADYKATPAYAISTSKDGQMYSTPESHPAKFPQWIIPDTRFPNEAARIVKEGGIVIRVENPRIIPSGDLHASETSLDDYDFNYTIVNDGGINTLIPRVETMLKAFKLLHDAKQEKFFH